MWFLFAYSRFIIIEGQKKPYWSAKYERIPLTIHSFDRYVMSEVTNAALTSSNINKRLVNGKTYLGFGRVTQ